VNLLLDGHSVTAPVPEKSFDGVHYEDDVYLVLTQLWANSIEAYQREHPYRKHAGRSVPSQWRIRAT
jgi:hypothetical protein